MLFFEFPEDARWNDERDAVEFSVILRPYEGTVRIGRRVFPDLFDQSPTAERSIGTFHLQRPVRDDRGEEVASSSADRRRCRDHGSRFAREGAGG